MNDLIEALQIFLKYIQRPDSYAPTACEHDDFIVAGIDFDNMTVKDLKRLNELGFLVGCDDDWCEELDDCYDKAENGEWQTLIDYAIENGLGCMHSFRFGSCQLD